MSRKLNDLSPRMLPLAERLLARCVEQGVAVAIVCTLRSPEEHAANLAKGTSRTKHSKHLDGDAIDICPYETWQAHGPDKLNWDTSDPTPWRTLGAIGESMGLRWGGRFKPLDRNGLGWDAGHFEYVEPVQGPRAA